MMPQREEPSVLDYLKERWADFWRLDAWAGRLRPAPAPRAETEAAAAARPQPEAETLPPAPAAPSPAAAQPVPAGPFSWRALWALFLALLAQQMLEPPHQGSGWQLAVFLYLLAAFLLGWAFWRGELILPLPPADAPRRDDGQVRTAALLPLLALTLAALLAFGNFRFTPFNLLLWGAALSAFFYAFWRAEGRPTWRLHWTPWRGLLLATALLVIFIRFYRLAEAPWEPFSDHAEKLFDVYDVARGEWRVFFPRNTGREAFQFYWTLLVGRVFGTGISYLSLKIGTVLIGLIPLPYVYLLGKEWGNRRVGWAAAFLMGVSYWQNVISRIGLRFPLYPAFTAPALYYLMRGLRTGRRNDFILSGLFLGIGLHGYSPFRVTPLLLLVVLAVYLWHQRARWTRLQALTLFGLLVLAAALVFLPLGRYMLSYPEQFSHRMLTRLTDAEQPLPGPVWRIFLNNVWRGLLMFNWEDGNIWAISIPNRPALGVVSGALFVLGLVLVLLRYLRHRRWQDLALLLAVPVLQLSSTLALAFPIENPALNRAGASAIPAFLFAGLALDVIWRSLENAHPRLGRALGAALVAVLFTFSTVQNYDLVLNKFAVQYDQGTWNSSEMAAVIRDFAAANGGAFDRVWIVPYPYWVDTRLPALWNGIPYTDFGKWREDLPDTLQTPPPKMFIVKYDDQETLDLLQSLYPQGILQYYTSRVPYHDFWIFTVLDQ